MKSRIVNSHDVFSSVRFDGSYHNADANIYENVISKHSQHNLSYYCSNIFTSGRNKRVYTSAEFGVPFFSNTDVSAQDPLNTCKFSSRKYGFDENAVLKGGMILTGRVGAIGQTTFVPNYWEAYKAMGSDNIIRIAVKPQFKNGFIYAYLASKIGNLSFWKHATGGVQPFITDTMVGGLPIPDFEESFKEEINDLIIQSANSRENAAQYLKQAVSYFDSLYVIKNKNQQFFKKRLKELNFSFASYNNNLEVADFRRQYENNCFYIKDETSRVFAPPLFKHIYLSKDNGYPFMTGGELSQYNLRYYRWLSPRGVGDINDYIVDEGTLLLYKSGSLDGMIGSVFIADKTIDKCCLSDHVIRVVFNKKELAYWTFAFLKSKGGVQMLKSLATGAAIPFITPERVSNLPIPSPDDNFTKITELVSNYISSISDSKKKEIQAIELVEQEIEKWNK